MEIKYHLEGHPFWVHTSWKKSLQQKLTADEHHDKINKDKKDYVTDTIESIGEIEHSIRLNIFVSYAIVLNTCDKKVKNLKEIDEKECE